MYMLTTFIEAHTHAQKKIHSFITFDEDEGMYVCTEHIYVCMYVCTEYVYVCMYVSSILQYFY